MDGTMQALENTERKIEIHLKIQRENVDRFIYRSWKHVAYQLQVMMKGMNCKLLLLALLYMEAPFQRGSERGASYQFRLKSMILLL